MALKHLLSGLLLSACWIAAELPPFRPQPAHAQSSPAAPDGLYYLYRGQRIPLTVRPDAIGVVASSTNTRSASTEPFNLQLQRVLQPSGTRGGSTQPAIGEASPLGATSSLVTVPPANAPQLNQLQTTIAQQLPGTQFLPVLSRSDRQEALVLPNEIVVSFEPTLSEAQIQQILTQQNLEIIRPIRFTTHRYLVRSRTATGAAVLNVANQLYEVQGVRSATPNFIPARSGREIAQPQGQAASPNDLQSRSSSAPVPIPALFQTVLFPYLWQLDSTPLLRTLNKTVQSITRSDLRIPEAWQNSRGGEGVVVAVIDASWSQWDHPNLENSLYTIKDPTCPGEINGWDFSDNQLANTAHPECLGDGDTRISSTEIASIREPFQDTFQLSDAALIQKYPTRESEVKESIGCLQQPSVCTDQQVAEKMRRGIRIGIASEFHGTQVSGMIVARPDQGQGVVGNAPNAKLMPIRFDGSPEQTETAVRYAANRGANVVNMSFGWDDFFPFLENVDETIAETLADNPNLIIVAAAGNSGTAQDIDPDRVRYPASNEGIVAVGATNLLGQRAFYSNYGSDLDVVAPGGDMSAEGGVLTTGGTFIDAFWQGIQIPSANASWGLNFDQRGGLTYTQGTSFASPAVAGVIALMMAEDPNRKLNRSQLVNILATTARQNDLRLSAEEADQYNSAVAAGRIPGTLSAHQYFFGAGLVDAVAAVTEVKKIAQKP